MSGEMRGGELRSTTNDARAEAERVAAGVVAVRA